MERGEEEDLRPHVLLVSKVDFVSHSRLPRNPTLPQPASQSASVSVPTPTYPRAGNVETPFFYYLPCWFYVTPGVTSPTRELRVEAG